MAPKRVDYGIRDLRGSANPADELAREIRSRIRDGVGPWVVGGSVSANELSRQVKLARGTVVRAMLRLVDEGLLGAVRGSGYAIKSAAPERRASTVVSVSEFCQEEKLELVSLLDTQSCRVEPLSELSEEVCRSPDERKRFEERIGKLLGLRPTDGVLFVRRVRGWRPKGSSDPLQWAILETLFLVERELEGLQQKVRYSLSPLSHPEPLGNLSLHRWMGSNGIEVERSRYALTLGPLSSRDFAAWSAVNPADNTRRSDVFIRLRAVTYAKGQGPLLYTVENLVPAIFELQVSGFQFGLSPSKVFP